MDKLTLEIGNSDFLESGLIDYLYTLDGIKFAQVNAKDDKIYVEYNSSAISLKLLKREILLYLNIKKIPSIIAFDKHDIKHESKYTIVIKDLCCEYCLNGMIEDLLEINGIISAHTDFDYHNKNNVNIFVTYNEKIISQDELDKITKQFNYNQ